MTQPLHSTQRPFLCARGCIAMYVQKPVPRGVLVANIKRVFLAGRAEFKARAKVHEGQTGEGTKSAADWYGEDDRSEVRYYVYKFVVLFVCVPARLWVTKWCNQPS